MVKDTWRCNQPKPEHKKYYKTDDPDSSPNESQQVENGGRTVKLTHSIHNLFCFNDRETLNHNENMVIYELQN